MFTKKSKLCTQQALADEARESPKRALLALGLAAVPAVERAYEFYAGAAAPLCVLARGRVIEATCLLLFCVWLWFGGGIRAITRLSTRARREKSAQVPGGGSGPSDAGLWSTYELAAAEPSAGAVWPYAARACAARSHERERER